MATLEITTLIGCPLACTFCPQDALTAAYGKGSSRMLSVEDFQAALSKLPSHVRIDFSGMSEPFKNPDCIKFVELSLDKGNPTAIYTTLSGLTPSDTDKLADYVKASRFCKFVIHLPDSSGNMRGFRYDENYLYALETLLPLSEVSCMTMSPEALIDEHLLEVVKSSTKRDQLIDKLPKGSFKGWRRAGSLNDRHVKDQPLEEKVEWKCGITCASTPFYDHNVMLPDGRVVLCCMDYGIKHVIGNLLEDSYEHLFDSAEMVKIRNINMSQDAEVKKECICTQCSNVCRWEAKDGGWIQQLPPVAKPVTLRSMARELKNRTLSKLPIPR
ncbi:MAG: SPASM domain-containing protein [Synechococcaceae cyanobacterium]|jgi:hypothetical protein